MVIRLRSLADLPRGPAPTVASVTYCLALPPSANHIWRHVVVKGRPRTLLSRQYKEWLKTAGEQLVKCGLYRVPSPVTVSIVLEGGKGFHRGRDLDNAAFKAVLDLLKKHGVIEDDNLCHVIGLQASFVRTEGESGVVVTVKSVEGQP